MSRLLFLVLFLSFSAHAIQIKCPQISGTYKLVDEKNVVETVKPNPLRRVVLRMQRKSQTPALSDLTHIQNTELGEPAVIQISESDGRNFLQLGGSEQVFEVDGRTKYVEGSYNSKVGFREYTARCLTDKVVQILEIGANVGSDSRRTDSYETFTSLHRRENGRILRHVYGQQFDINGDLVRVLRIQEVYQLESL